MKPEKKEEGEKSRNSRRADKAVNDEMEVEVHNLDDCMADNNRKVNVECQTDISYLSNVSVGCQTGEDLVKKIEDLTQQVEELEEKLKSFLLDPLAIALQEKCYQLEEKLKSYEFSEKSFEKNDEKVLYFTGLGSYSLLKMVFNLVKEYITETKICRLNKFQQFLLTLMKLRKGYDYTDLGYRFGISRQTASNYFHKVLVVLYRRLLSLILWPKREKLKENMPECFKVSFGESVVVIVDCFEIFTEKPSDLLTAAAMWSNYKHHYTCKFLIGISPLGSVTYISEGWGGRTSDKHITEKSSFLNLLETGDVVMADRGFLIEDALKEKEAELVIPAFTKGKSQLDPLDVEGTRKIANVRIHVERVIGTIRQKFKILHRVLPMTLIGDKVDGVHMIDMIVTVCCALHNLNPPIVPTD